MSRTTVLILAVVSAIFLLFALIVAIGSAREKARRAGPSAPPSRRPGPTDEALEGPLLERYQVAGVALTVFLAILLPFLYLREPVRQKAAASKELTESVRLGQATFTEFCARCHGPNAEGGVVKRYPDQDVAAVAWETIQKGRPPTPMPTWGVRYGGPMNDQQITDLVNYILSIQSDDKERPLLEFEAAGGQRAQ
jgi:mono/diheme cytochrome c family protein